MKEYVNLVLQGDSTIHKRKEILAIKKESLVEKLKEIQKSINYIDWKQTFYDDIISGKITLSEDDIKEMK